MILYTTVLHYSLLCYAMLCYAMQCYTLWQHTTLCCSKFHSTQLLSSAVVLHTLGYNVFSIARCCGVTRSSMLYTAISYGANDDTLHALHSILLYYTTDHHMCLYKLIIAELKLSYRALYHDMLQHFCKTYKYYEILHHDAASHLCTRLKHLMV